VGGAAELKPIDLALEVPLNAQWFTRHQNDIAGGTMLWTIFVILLVMWLLGLVTSYTLGGFIHILLVVALAVALIQIISGRRVV